jgi:hypothetical protein
VNERLGVIKSAEQGGQIDPGDAKSLSHSVLRSYVEPEMASKPEEKTAAAKLMDNLPAESVTSIESGDTKIETAGGGGGGVLGAWLRTVMGAVPTATATNAKPGWRACCALGQWLFGGSGALDPTTLGGHHYAPPGGPTGYVYTAKAGLVDLGHTRDLIDMTKFIYDALAAGTSHFDLFEGTATVHRIPAGVSSLADLAGAMAYVESWAHELTTWDDYSSFSPEDLPSNVIGIEIAKRAINTGGSFDATVDTILDSLVNGELGARPKADTAAVLTKIKGDWFDTKVGAPPFELLRRNFDGAPWPAGRSSRRTTPSSYTRSRRPWPARQASRLRR